MILSRGGFEVANIERLKPIPKHHLKPIDKEACKRANSPIWRSVTSVVNDLGLDRNTFYIRKMSEPDIFKDVGLSEGGMQQFINMNEYSTYGRDFNPKREYHYMTMYDEIYFGLTRFLNKSEIAELCLKLIPDAADGTTLQSWIGWMSQPMPSMDKRALAFIRLGKHILQTKALYRNFTPDWEQD